MNQIYYTGVYGQLRYNENHNEPSHHQYQIDCYVCNAGRYGQKRYESGALELTQQALTPHGFLDGNLGMDPTVVSSEGSTALIQAADAGYSTVVQYILEQTPSEQREDFINFQDGRKAYKGDTALIWAARNGHVDVVQALLGGGANVHVRGKDNNTALIWAARNGHVDVVRALLDAGANVNDQDRQGYTALMKAAYRGHSEVVHCLLTHPKSRDFINVNIRSNSPNAVETAYSLAGSAMAQKSYGESVQRLLRSGGKIDFLAEAKDGNVGLVKIYMNSLQGNDAKKKALQTMDSENRNVLIVAAASGNQELVRYILDEASKVMSDEEYRNFVNSSDCNGYTPLMHAVASGSKETVEVFFGHTRTRQYLFPNQRNSQGHTALWVARELKRIDQQKGEEMESLLKKNGVTDYGENLHQVLRNHSSSVNLQEDERIGSGRNNQTEIV